MYSMGLKGFINERKNQRIDDMSQFQSLMIDLAMKIPPRDARRFSETKRSFGRIETRRISSTRN